MQHFFGRRYDTQDLRPKTTKLRQTDACRLYDGSTNTPDNVYVGGTESNYDYNFKHSAGFTNTSRDQSGQTVYVTDGTGIDGVVRAASALYGRSASGNTLVIDLGGKTRAETKLSLTGVADVKTYDIEDRHTFSSIAAASGEWGGGNLENNTLRIENSLVEAGSIYAAYASSGHNKNIDTTVSGNTLTITNATLGATVSQHKDLGRLAPRIYAAHIQDTFPLSGTKDANYVTYAKNNHVKLDRVEGEFEVIYGAGWNGYWPNAFAVGYVQAENNSVTIVDSNLTKTATGASGMLVGGMAHSQTQSGEELGWNRNASVTVERSTVDVDTAKAGFSIYGGFRGGVVENAAVTLKDSTFTLSSLETDKGYGNLYGAYVAAVFATTRDLTATGTRVTVDNTKLEGPNWNRLTTVMVDATAYRDYAGENPAIPGILAKSVSVTDNHFTVTNGSVVNGSIYGARVLTEKSGVVHQYETGDAVMESSLSAFGTLFAADDLFVDTVLKSSTGRPDGAFAAARGGRYTFDTRTRIDSNIFNAIFGYGLEVADGTELDGFIETGHASYDTETGGNDGSGTHNYAGAGLYLSQSLGLEGLRATAYVKGGMIRNDFDIRLADTQVDFEKSSAYWGAHAGLSYDWTPTAMLEARSFVNYFYDGRSSESYDFAGTDTVKGASFDYDALNGHRVQVGTPAGGLSEWMGSALRVFVRIRRRGQRR